MSDGSDLAWLGLERHGPGHWSFELTSGLARHDAKLYGGTGAAVMAAVMEAETARDALWTTVQFVGSAELGERIECQVDVLASGRRTSQVRLTATVGDRVVITGLGSAGAGRPNPPEAQVPKMPAVASPEECNPWGSGRQHSHAPATPQPNPSQMTGWHQLAEMRQATESGSIWARMRSGMQTRATVSFLGDMVPTSVVRAAGMMGAGTSLDNSLRFGKMPETEWVLLDMDPWLATGGYLHGAARVWSQDGTLVAVASQTAAALVFEQPPSPPLEG